MSSPVLNEERVRPYEKPVTTKDIANLYSHLQTMIDNVPKSPRLETNTELPITPTTSSSLSRSSPLKPDCPCHHILVSKDSRHCALCDDVIPILADIQQDREKKQKDIAELKQQLFAQETESKSSRIELLAQQKKYQQINDQLQKTKEQYANVKKDLSVLQQKYETEKKEADEVKRAKASVENELEELSQKLFEEANGMVATEKRAKHLLEIQYQRLKQELESCKHQMEAEELQLKELKSKMGDMEEQHKREHRLSNNGSCISTADEEDDSQEKRASRDMASLFHHPEEIIDEDPTDPLILNEFKEFVESGESIPIRKIHSMPYMKNSLTDDVEPCLRFGPNSRLSARKLYEAILLNTCFIEESPYGFAQDQAKRPYDVPLRISAAKNLIWERLSTPTAAPPFAGCQACGRSSKSDLPYRFRISMLDDWACIDRYCRDRLVSVCEFYMFIRNVRQGYYNGRTIPDLYRESIRLKLQMFYARMGTLSQALYRVGVKGDIIGHASAPNMVIPPPIKIKHADGNNPVDEISATSSDISDISAKVSDDEQEEDSPARRSSMHPGNSVWIAHSF